MEYSESEVVHRLRQAGERLSLLPTQVDVLLPLLDEVENLLKEVEQSPSELIQNAYSQSMKALLDEQILRHTDGDVKVAVASCISEITRITAPEAPYSDDEMKEVFQLIVSSFADLSDMSSRSYDKRASILETVAKVRSCVVMLDLECEVLISKMFQHFLTSLRDEHPENISASMETIMTLVLEESEDVTLELLTPILASLKRNSEEIPTAAKKLGENVFAKCAAKLRPYLKQAVKVLGLPLDSYSEIVSTICSGSNGEAEHNDGNVSSLEQLAGEGKLTTSAFVEASQDARDPVTEEPCLEDIPPEVQKSMKSLSNEMTETGDEELSNVSENSRKPEESIPSNKSLDVQTSKVDPDDIDTAKASKVDDIMQVKIAKKRGRKPRSTKPSNPSRIGGDNEAEITCQKVSDIGAEKLPDLGKDAHASIDEDSLIDTKASPAKEQVPISSLEPLENEVNVSSGSPNKSLRDESPGVSRKEENLAQEDAIIKSASGNDFAGASGKEISPESHSEKEKLNLAQEDTLLMDSAPTEAADVNSDSEVKPQKRFGKKKESFVQEHESSEDPHAVIVAGADGGSDLEIKPRKLSGKKKGDQEDEPSVDLDSTKVSGGSSDSEKEVQKQSGKKTENLAKEGTPVESLSPMADDNISDSEDKPQRRSGKKAARSKKTTRISKGKMPERKGTTKIDTEVSSDEELEPQKQSSEEDERDLGMKPSMPPGKQSTSRHREKPLTNSGKGNVSDTKLPSMKKDTANEGNGSVATSSDESEPEMNPLVQSSKGKRSRPRGKPRKSLGRGSVSGTKPPSKKEEATNMDRDISKKKSERRAHGKNTDDKVLLKSQENDNDQDMVTFPKSTSKVVKDDDQFEDSKTNSKRKRTPGKVSGDLEYGVNLVGARIKVWWPDDEQYYEGIIESFDRAKKKHKVSYTDGDEEVLLLHKEKWELVDDMTIQDTNDDSNPDSSAKSRSRKKAKESTVQTEKQKRMDVSPRSVRGGAAASSKLKGMATKSGGKVDSRSRDKVSKTTSKSEENSDSDDMSADDVPGVAKKSKDKSKFETPKTVTKAKAKTPQGGNTSNGTGKAKSSLSKVKDSGKTPEISKVKSADTSKAGKSRGSGKKRRRGY